MVPAILRLVSHSIPQLRRIASEGRRRGCQNEGGEIAQSWDAKPRPVEPQADQGWPGGQQGQWGRETLC